MTVSSSDSTERHSFGTFMRPSLHLGLPFAVLSVVGSPARWNIEVRVGSRRRGPLYGPWQPAAGDAGRDSGEAGSGAVVGIGRTVLSPLTDDGSFVSTSRLSPSRCAHDARDRHQQEESLACRHCQTIQFGSDDSSTPTLGIGDGDLITGTEKPLDDAGQSREPFAASALCVTRCNHHQEGV